MMQRFVCLLLVGIALVGCSSVKDSLGIASANVDQYMIEPHDITLPPDYKARPPRAGEPSNTEKISETAVEDALKKP